MLKAFLGTVLGLPLAAMLVGLLAALTPVDWRHWVVLILLLVVVVWAVLIVVSGLAGNAWRTGAALVAGNGIVWLLLQTTSLYGGR